MPSDQFLHTRNCDVVLGTVGIDVGFGGNGCIKRKGVGDSGASLVLDAAVARSAADAGRVAVECENC